MADKQNKLNKKKEDKKLREMGYNKEELPFEVRLAEREQAPKKERAKLSPTAITAIATGAVVLALGIAFLIWFLVHNYKQDPRFDYLESDLNGYVDFSPEDYKSYKVEIDIAEPHRKKKDEGGKLTGVSDVEVAIMNLLCSKSELIDDAAQSLTATVEMGDTVYVRFRGYRLDSEGKMQHLAGLSDFTNAEPTKIAIGNNTLSMIGLDLGLIGVDPEYANRGISAVVSAALMRMLSDGNIEYAETNLNLETNYSIQNQWKRFKAVPHKRRRSYVKVLTAKE